MTPIPEESARSTSTNPVTPWALLRWPVMAALLALVVLASAPRAAPPGPAREEAPGLPRSSHECGPQALVLPPGHPPISRALPGGLQGYLPPGHPPIDGRVEGMSRPRTPFTSPEIVDL